MNRYVSEREREAMPRLDAPGTLHHVIIRGIEEQPIVTDEEDWQQVMSGSFDNTLKFWDVQSGQLLRSLEGHTDWITSVAVIPDGHHVVSGFWDNRQGLRPAERPAAAHPART
jgi:hypothetical protein